MFIQNKYTKCYWKIIHNAKLRTEVNGYGEVHHIIPVSLGGNHKNINKVKVTAKEHFICHLLLTKMCISKKHKKSMIFAYFACRSSADNVKRYSSRTYEIIRKKLAKECSGKNNPFYGKTHSKASLKKMAENRPNTDGKNNSFYGKTHSEKTKDTLRNLRSISIIVFFINGTKKEFFNRIELGLFLGKNKHFGNNLLKDKSKHRWKDFGIADIKAKNENC